MRILKGKSSVELARMTGFQLLRLAYCSPPPEILRGLAKPREQKDYLDPLLTEQRQVAGLVVELRGLHNAIQLGQQWARPDLQSETLHGLERHVNWIWANLYAEARNQVELESWQEHIEISEDGNIYGCPGDCPSCLDIKMETAETYHGIVSRPPDDKLN